MPRCISLIAATILSVTSRADGVIVVSSDEKDLRRPGLRIPPGMQYSERSVFVGRAPLA